MTGDISISRRPLWFKIVQEDTEVAVNFDQKEEMFLKHVKEEPANWLSQ